MTDEERQRQMDFILSQQAQFAADMGKLKEADERADKRIGRLERVVRLVIRAGLRERRDFRERSGALLDSQIRLNEAQARTDERLNNLITVVEKHIASGRNGNDNAAG